MRESKGKEHCHRLEGRQVWLLVDTPREACCLLEQTCMTGEGAPQHIFHERVEVDIRRSLSVYACRRLAKQKKHCYTCLSDCEQST